MLELILYSGIVLLCIYGFVALRFFSLLWHSARPRSLRAGLIKVAAALTWPYVIYQVFTEAWE